MEFILEADIKLVSVNRAFIITSRGHRIKSPEYIEFQNKIYYLMAKRRDEFLEFNKQFDPFKHEIHAELTYFTNELYTKDGKINQRSGDTANMEKCLTDCILTNYIDDSAITQWILLKKQRILKGFRVSFKIIDRELN